MLSVVPGRVLRALVLTTVVALPAPLLAVAPAHASSGPSPDRRVRTEAHRVDRVPTPRPTWFDCGELYGSRAQCTMVALPLDYDHPLGPTTQVAVLRIPATNPARRIGSLFVNPGGPGGSGVELAAAAPDFLGADVLASFDIVGFDPRGTNLSDGVRCWPDSGAQRAALAGLAPMFPVGPTQEAAAVRSARAFGAACSGTGRPLSASVSTAQVARDMDVLRRMVGDRRLSYLGFSYGSYLGEVYAGLFPDRVRAMVLDGVIDPVAWAGTPATRNTPVTTRLGSAQADAQAVRELLSRCRTAGPARCRLAGRGDPAVVYRGLLRSVRTTPIVFRDGGFSQTFTYADVVGTLLDILYGQQPGPDLDDFLSFLLDLRDPAATPKAKAVARAGLHRIAARRAAVRTTARVTPAERAAFRRLARRAGYGFPYDNGPDAYASVMCTDGLAPSVAAHWPSYADNAARTGGGFGPLWAWASAPCARASWTARDEDAFRGPFSRRPAGHVLIVGALHDPATPYAGAVRAQALILGSRLVTSTNWGHTSYGTSACVDSAVDAYLVTKLLPRNGLRCAGEQPFTGPPILLSASAAGKAASGPRAATTTRRAGTGRALPPIAPLRP